MNVGAVLALTGAVTAFSAAALTGSPAAKPSATEPLLGQRQTTLAQARPPVAPSPSGEDLYLRDCAWCHGNRLEGTARAPSLIGRGEAATRFYLTTGRMPIGDPAEPIRRRPAAYTPEEIRAIVDHVTGLGGGPPRPPVDLAAGDLGAGGHLYRLHCGACHGATGAGFPLLAGRMSPPVWHATPREVAEAIRVGPGGMPVFSAETLSDDEVNSIVRYVMYLQDPDDRGGLHLFRVGPVIEGAVAWLAGLGLLLVAVRLLGARS